MSVERAQEVVSAVGALRQVPDSPAEVRQRAILSCVRPQSSRQGPAAAAGGPSADDTRHGRSFVVHRLLDKTKGDPGYAQAAGKSHHQPVRPQDSPQEGPQDHTPRV